MSSAIPINVARQVLAELVRRGEVKPSSREEMAGKVEGYSTWLESYVTALLFEELGRLGKVSEYRVFPEGSDIKRDEFFGGLIPHYVEFLEMAMTLAVQALLGKSEPSSSKLGRTDA
jgi:hypothetical protein